MSSIIISTYLACTKVNMLKMEIFYIEFTINNNDHKAFETYWIISNSNNNVTKKHITHSSILAFTFVIQIWEILIQFSE